MILADQFATTPAGFIAGLGTLFLTIATPIFATILFRRNDTRRRADEDYRRKNDEIQNKQVVALALLMSKDEVTSKEIAKIADLQSSLLVLDSKVDSHIRDAEVTRQELSRRIENLGSNNGKAPRPY